MHGVLLSYSKFNIKADAKADTWRYIVTAVGFKGLGHSSEISADNETGSDTCRRDMKFFEHVPIFGERVILFGPTNFTIVKENPPQVYVCIVH